MKNIREIRKAVVTLANRINKKTKDLSSSFKRAWQIVKGKELVTRVKGVTFGNRRKALKHLSRYTKERINVNLVRDYGNKYDNNAIKVIVSVDNGRGYTIGFLPKEIAEEIAILIDKGFDLIAKYKTITGGILTDCLGCLIDIIL